MAANEILQFAPTDTGTNLLTQAQYLAATDRTNGNQPGIASAKLVNKQMRQSSLMAAGLAQFVADNQATDIVDSLTPTQVSAAIGNAFQGRLLALRVFDTPGSLAYVPTTGTKSVVVIVVGGGGGGGGAAANGAGAVSAGAGGGGAGWAVKRISSGFAGATITVGAAGVGVSAASGTAGGASSFGAFVTGSGGGGGSVGNSQSVTAPFVTGAGGPSGASGGDYNGAGGPGTYALYLSNNGSTSGKGGGSFGAPGTSWVSTNNSSVVGTPGTSYGVGGSGASSSASQGASAGGAGYRGCVIVYEYQ